METPSAKPSPAAGVHRAPGVEYTEILGAAAPMFSCAAYRARLLTTACARRWRQAQSPNAPDSIALCAGCRIGAQHSGEKPVYYSRLFGSNICPRCGRGSGRRLIGGRRCVSCYNRARELAVGKNAKGSPPIHAMPLYAWAVRYTVDGGAVQTLAVPDSRDVGEVMLHVLRSTRGRVAFISANTGAPVGPVGQVAA
jgi:hypothetical protein